MIQTNIYIVDSHRESRVSLMRWAIDRGFRGRPFLSAADFIAELPHLTCGITLVDVQNAGANDFDVIEAVTRTAIACPVIGMMEAADTNMAVAALKRGAVDFLVKPINLPALHEAVASAERIMDQRRSIAEQATRDRTALDRLSQRERQVLAALAAGKTSKQIAGDIGISVRTVEAYRSGLVGKLEAPNVGAGHRAGGALRDRLFAHVSRTASACVA